MSRVTDPGPVAGLGALAEVRNLLAAA